MERRGPERKPKGGRTARSFYWLNSEIEAGEQVSCTRGEGHYMQKTETQGEGLLKGTTLWVCAACEPRVGGKWLAEVENDPPGGR